MTSAARRFGLGAVALLVAAAYAPLMPWLVERWRAPDGFFSHGPLVPLASGWLLWRRRHELAASSREGDWRGLLLIAPALALLLVSGLLRFDSPALATLLLLLPGLLVLLGGVSSARAAAAPIAFLAFAMPWPMELLADVVQSLKLLVVAASAALVNLSGAGIVARGSWLLLPGGDRLLVDDECSGLSSAIALLALWTFMAATARRSPPSRRLLLVLLSLPVALAANVARVTLLAAIGVARGADRVAAWHHSANGASFCVALVALLLLERGLRARPLAEPPP